jgi:D-glycerate 3-kinase
VGINGSQGSGKSTLSKILHLLLSRGFDKRVVVISIDDLYLSRSERLHLAAKVHPLLATRGVPGTHDTQLARQILTRLKQGKRENLTIPVFDKARDDRAPASRWQNVSGPVDIILFEGWCVGSAAQPEQELDRAINSLESMDDGNQQWRRYVNQQLAGPYRELFDLIDVLVMLKIPDMKHVFEWRLLQENKLRQSLAEQPEAAQRVMTEKELKRFIMHYERITRSSLKEMPDRADVVLQLNAQHQVDTIVLKGTK